MAPPEQLVAAAIEHGLFRSGAVTALPGERIVHLRRFEIDLQGPPTARVVLQFGPAAGSREFVRAAAVASRAPPAVAATTSGRPGTGRFSRRSGSPGNDRAAPSAPSA